MISRDNECQILFSHMVATIAYFKEINRVLSAVTASSKYRNALSNSGTLQVILHVSKAKDFSTRCSNPETREVMWEKMSSTTDVLTCILGIIYMDTCLCNSTNCTHIRKSSSRKRNTKHKPISNPCLSNRDQCKSLF